MSHAAFLSGVALTNSGLGMAHGVAAALGVECGTPHGLACAVMLPVALRVNATAAEHDFALLERAVDPAAKGDDAARRRPSSSVSSGCAATLACRGGSPRWGCRAIASLAVRKLRRREHAGQSGRTRPGESPADPRGRLRVSRTGFSPSCRRCPTPALPGSDPRAAAAAAMRRRRRSRTLPCGAGLVEVGLFLRGVVGADVEVVGGIVVEPVASRSPSGCRLESCRGVSSCFCRRSGRSNFSASISTIPIFLPSISYSSPAVTAASALSR